MKILTKLISLISVTMVLSNCGSLGDVKKRMDENPTISVNLLHDAYAAGRSSFFLTPEASKGIDKIIADAIKSDWPSDKVSLSNANADLQMNVYCRAYESKEISGGITSLVIDVQMHDKKNNKWLIQLPKRIHYLDLPKGEVDEKNLNSSTWLKKFKDEAAAATKVWLKEIKAAT